MPSAVVELALREALRLQREGSLTRAGEIYRQVLAMEPGNADALHLLGMVELSSGRAASAVPLMERAIVLLPKSAHFHSNLANARRELGQFEEAERGYRRALELGARLPEVHNNYGITLLQMGRDAEAEAQFREAIRLRPAHAAARANLSRALLHLGRAEEALTAAEDALLNDAGLAAGMLAKGAALRVLGRLVEAEASHRSAIEREESAEAWIGLARVLSDQRRDTEAVDAAGRATALRPTDHGVWTNLGSLLMAAGRCDEASSAFARSAELMPGFVPAWSNLGAALTASGRLIEAEEALRKGLGLAPGDHACWRNLAVLYGRAWRREEAVSAAEKALEAAPDDPESHHALGVAHEHNRRSDLAVACFRRAIELDPAYAKAHEGLAVACEHLAMFPEAIREYDAAATLDPDTHSSRMKLGMVRMLTGDLAQGWRDYESRIPWMGQLGVLQHFDRPRWDPSLPGRPRLVVYGEQGLGDLMQFIRAMPMLKQRASTVIVSCKPEVAALAATAPGVDLVVPEGHPLPDYDAWVPLLSVPWELGHIPHELPARVPYLRPPPGETERWRQRLASLPAGLRVGIVWSGSPLHHNDHNRSIPLRTLGPVAEVRGVNWVNLQKGPGARQIVGSPFAGVMTDWMDECGDYADTAALVANLDLVIAVDTSVCHLAGALGRQVWTLLPFVPDWRWMLERETTPWYPTMRLWRQPTFGDWTSVVDRLRAALSRLAAGESGP
jgi:Flp pilus assembly protein TadD